MMWTRIGKTVNEEGTTIIYEAVGHPFKIESRKRHIPHSNRAGTWDHTTYVVLFLGEEVAEKNSLRDAKRYADELLYKEGKA